MIEMKAVLPVELKQAMQLDDDQFEELEKDTLECCLMYVPALKELDLGLVQMDVAWKPSRNPRSQYFAMAHALMVDPDGNEVRHEVRGFKPMEKKEYREYCVKEYGADPFFDPSAN